MKMGRLLKYLSTIIIGLSLFNCLYSKEEKENAAKYKLEQVLFEKEINFKTIESIENFEFTPNRTSERFRIKLYYLNFNKLDMDSQKDHLINIYKSLVSFSVELYDKAKNELIYSYSISDNKIPSYSGITPSLFLGSFIKIEKSKSYNIIIKIPPKINDIADKYLHPVLVGGVLEKPWL